MATGGGSPSGAGERLQTLGSFVGAGVGGGCWSDRCQRCGAQLRIVDELPPATDVTQSFRGAINESFVVVPNSDPDEFVVGRRDVGATPGSGSPGSWDSGPQCPSLDEVARVEKIMALASGQTDQDHPVCGDCLQAVVLEVQRQVDEAQEEHRRYQEAHARLEEQLQAFSHEDAEQVEADIAEMEAEERRLLEQLRGFDREEAELQEDLERCRRQEEALKREEDELWLALSEQQLALIEAEEEHATTASAILYSTTELNRLQKTNVLNDMFHIAHHGQFGTINRFRMGKLPDNSVPWEEINAAWGQACLLLDALTKKCGVPMGQYRLLPRGSFSAIQAGGEVLQLHCNDGGLKSFFNNRHFDLAMMAFLDCLKDVVKFLQRDPKMRLPFAIESDKVGGFSVRVLFNPQERWTKALKFMLTDLKWMVAFVESRDRGDAGAPSPGVSGPSSSQRISVR